MTPDQSSTSATGATQSDNQSAKKAKMTGCVQSQGSGYALVDKKHPNGVQLLSSEDLSAHVGHKVEVKGTWEAASSSASTSPSGTSTSASSSAPSSSNPNADTSAAGAGSSAGTGSSSASSLPQSDQGANQAIRVTEVKMKSDKCDMTSSNNSPSKY
jgi:hypothetical protein